MVGKPKVHINPTVEIALESQSQSILILDVAINHVVNEDAYFWFLIESLCVVSLHVFWLC